MSQQSNPGPPDLSSYFQSDQGTGETQETEPQPQSQEGQVTDSLGSDFLKNIPDNERPIVEKYVKDWDAGVTKKFQEIHGQYEPYKQFGSVEDVQQAIELMQLLENDPAFVKAQIEEYLASQPGGNQQNQQTQQIQTPPTQQVQTNPQLEQALQPFLKPLQEENQKLQGYVEKIAQALYNQDQSSKEAQEDAALDAVLRDLETTHGKFDVDAVLYRMYQNGGDTEKAWKDWHDSIQAYIPQQQSSNLPPVFSGEAISSEPVDVGNMPNKDIVSLVAGIMENTANQ
jgi:hypothetical protein